MTLHRLFRRLAFGLLATSALAGLSVAQAVEPVPIEAFFSPGKLQLARMSPNGRWLAAQTSVPGRRVGFIIIDLDNKEASRFIEASPKDDLTWFRWVGDEWLVFQLRSPADRSTNALGEGLVAVKRDGTSSRMLIAREFEHEDPMSKRRYLEPDHFYLHGGAPGSTEVIVGQAQFRNRQFSHIVPKVLDITTGVARTMLQDAPRADTWYFDIKGRARVARLTSEGETITWWADKAGKWTQISKAPDYEQPFVPLVPDGDDDLLVTTSAPGDGSYEVRRFDFAAGRPASVPMLTTPGYNTINYTIADKTSARVLGLEVVTDGALMVWFSPEMKAIQAKVDAKFQGNVNIIQCSPCDATGHILVFTYSDRDPGSYVLYLPKEDKWRLVGEVRPDIDPRRMASQDFQRIKARDGRDLPVWITRPPGSAASGGKPAPAVVLVHGGPWVRGTFWGFDAEAQFLASRGYVVIEPEFRGSKGYGETHYRAGWKQWGRAMQDDISDSLRYAVAQGWADPKRACIMGGSYGGYAALMGLIKDPDQYRCGVAHAAVVDPRLMYDFHLGVYNSNYRQFDLPLVLGDLVKDAALLAEGAPVEHAARIKVPLLLTHGGRDYNVPIAHGERMLDALRKNGKDVEWKAYPEEDHSFLFDENRYDYYRRVEAFLAKHLKP